MIDIHCHLLPGLDDGASDWPTALEMARLASSDGIETMIVTPHQLGSYRQNTGQRIRERVAEFRARLAEAEVNLKILPGGDVRIESDLVDRLQDDDVLTLADQRRHVLLELPHEVYIPLEPVLVRLATIGLTGILSHPERNQGILADPSCLSRLIAAGCLMQVTAGSLLGAFGSASQQLAEQMLRQGMVHFLATDAHGIRTRRPRLQAAYQFVARLVGTGVADQLCRLNPERVVRGEPIPVGCGPIAPRPRRWWEATLNSYTKKAAFTN